MWASSCHSRRARHIHTCRRARLPSAGITSSNTGSAAGQRRRWGRAGRQICALSADAAQTLPPCPPLPGARRLRAQRGRGAAGARLVVLQEALLALKELQVALAVAQPGVCHDVGHACARVLRHLDRRNPTLHMTLLQPLLGRTSLRPGCLTVHPLHASWRAASVSCKRIAHSSRMERLSNSGQHYRRSDNREARGEVCTRARAA